MERCFRAEADKLAGVRMDRSWLYKEPPISSTCLRGYLLRAVRRLTLRWKLQILSYFYSFQSFQSIFGLYMMKQYVVKLRKLFPQFYTVFFCFWCHTLIMEDFLKSHKKGIQYQRKPLFVSWSSTLITKNHDFYQLDIHYVLYGSFCFLYRFH